MSEEIERKTNSENRNRCRKHARILAEELKLALTLLVFLLDIEYNSAVSAIDKLDDGGGGERDPPRPLLRRRPPPLTPHVLS